MPKYLICWPSPEVDYGGINGPSLRTKRYGLRQSNFSDRFGQESVLPVRDFCLSKENSSLSSKARHLRYQPWLTAHSDEYVE